ncbi:hypothetical protein [Treponema sp.]|uniref:hypothetical protein n=1 Tax=Treponema sp. TaxID=166 RepID=UPI0025E15AF1|nr:hypothetical protein [Treponema sp.]MCR5218001.1 hypothetical protein [Treponema sp.]
MKNVKILAALLIFAVTPLVAQDFGALDQAVNDGNCDLVLSILESSGSDASKMEERVLDAAGNLVMASNYDLAMELTETVLLFNMDNSRAQEMYTSIEKAKKDKIREEKEALIVAEQKKAELKAQRMADYKVSVKEYYRSLAKVSYRNFPLEAGLIPLSFNLSSTDFAEESSAMRYGFGAEFKASFVHPGIRLDLGLDYIYQPVILSGQGEKSDLNMRAAVTSPVFPIPFSVSAAYKSRWVTSDASLYKVLSFPAIGIGLDGFEILPDFSMTAFLDFDLCSSAADSMIDFALGGEVSFKYVFRVKPLIGIYLAEKNRFDIFVIDSSSESYLDAALSVGIILNER